MAEEEETVGVEHAFQSLYRRYRPQRFAEVRGQDHVTLALTHAVRDGRVAHAYLFSGPRGTGKTSTARILAKALNCAAPKDGEPCGVCDSCVAITRGSSFDVHELDAASNNGVDAMRDLVARAGLATPGRWKVYIVDEVHMLSTAASNALLKTLEEPPGHVVFVLATTDPQKVLPTIRSRTQHFEFHLLGDELLGALLADVAADADLHLPERSFEVVVRRAKGSARDALSALDQVAAAGVVEDDLAVADALVAAIDDRDTALALRTTAQALELGRDPQRLAVEIVERLRDAFLFLVAPELGSQDDGIADRARSLGAPRCVRAMEVIGEAIPAMREAPEPRITLEVALIRLCLREADDSPSAILERLHRLERIVAEGDSGAPRRPTPPSAPSPGPAPGPAPVHSPATPRAGYPATPGASGPSSPRRLRPPTGTPTAPEKVASDPPRRVPSPHSGPSSAVRATPPGRRPRHCPPPRRSPQRRRRAMRSLLRTLPSPPQARRATSSWPSGATASSPLFAPESVPFTRPADSSGPRTAKHSSPSRTPPTCEPQSRCVPRSRRPSVSTSVDRSAFAFSPRTTPPRRAHPAVAMQRSPMTRMTRSTPRSWCPSPAGAAACRRYRGSRTGCCRPSPALRRYEAVSLEGMPDLGELVAKVQELQEHIAQAQAAAAAEIVEGSAGDGAVLVRMTGSLDALGVSIDPRVVDSSEVDLLEDLVLAAIRDATARARALGQDALGDLGIDPGLTGLLG